MVARLRQIGEAAPVYESGIEEFSVEVHHGGFFVGHGHFRSYVNGKISWFDHVDTDTWSPLWLDQFVEDLGYLRTGNLKFYWLLPGKDVSDGLRVIVTDTDTNVMASVVDRHKNLVVYFDSEDSFANVEWDDVIFNPIASLPKVISPKKVDHVPKKHDEKLPNFYTNLEDANGSDSDSGSDSDYEDFVDSDYELCDGDDDLYADYVDENVVEEGVKISKGKKAKGSRLKGGEAGQRNCNDQDSSDDEDLDLPEDECEVTMNFKSWKEEDMNNPTFKVGLVFPSVVELRRHMSGSKRCHQILG